MTRAHQHSIRWPASLWAAIETEAARRDTSVDILIVVTMDAEIRKTQGDYTAIPDPTQMATEDHPREGFLDRLSERARYFGAVTWSYAIELMYALRLRKEPGGSSRRGS